MPIGERADEIGDCARPVPVALAVGRCLDFGHPVDELQAVGVRGANRIDHHLAVRQPSRPHHAGAGSSPRAARSLVACGRRLIPTPTAFISVVDSNIRQRIPASCSASPSVNPLMPAPTIMTASMFPPGRLVY